MRFDVITIFPAMVEQALRAGIIGRAIERGTLGVRVHDLRDYTTDRHRVVDDEPYGGGPGMVLKPEPIFRALDAIRGEDAPPFVVLTSPQGTRFTQDVARRLSGKAHVVLLCGRYEGIDERVRARIDEEVSIGDYVLSGGELAAAVVVDATMRLIPGVLGNEASGEFESFGAADAEIEVDVEGVPRSQHGAGGLLDYPHYTRPAEFMGMRAPEVLMNGDHAEIRRWRREQQLRKTLKNRPDLLEGAALSAEDRRLIEAMRREDARKG